MITNRRLCILIPLLTAIALTPRVSAAAFDGKTVLESMNVESDDIRKLEDGEVVTFSGEPYEQSKRELTSDAVVLINKSLDRVLKEINEEASLIPRKVTLGYQDIESEADFDGIGFDINDDRDVKEVETLYKLKKAKNYNLTLKEFEVLKASLDLARNGSLEEKTEAASKAIRVIMLGRYRAYRERGLAGIEPYQRGRKQVDIGQELRITTETLDVVEDHLPEYYNNLLYFPANQECCQQRFRWLRVKLDKRPAFVLTHSSVLKTDEILIITERHFYVTHSLNSVQITVAWLPYEEGTYMGLAMSAQANILQTFLGGVLRGSGRNASEELVRDVLTDIRAELEGTSEKDADSMDFIKSPDPAL